MSLDCDIHWLSPSKMKAELPCRWSDEKLKSLWSSLLNLELVSKHQDDSDLQGMLMLLETTFIVFKSLKNRYDNSEKAYQIMKCDLESTKENLCQVKEDIECCKKIPCHRCLELEKELIVQKKKLECSENQIKSIVNILTFNAISEKSSSNQQAAVTKAYNLVSQMLLDDKGVILESTTEHLQPESTRVTQMRTQRKRRKTSNTLEAEAVIDTNKEMKNLCHVATLAPESLPADENVEMIIENKIVPETFCSHDSILKLNSMDFTEEVDNIPTTPKKNMSQHNGSKGSSPILGGSSRKAPPKVISSDDSQDNNCKPCETSTENGKLNSCISNSNPVYNCEAGVTVSPSILKTHCGVSNSTAPDSDTVGTTSHEDRKEQNVLHLTQVNKESVQKIKADFWKLKSRKAIGAGNCKLKQTTLSLACFTKKQDLCNLTEFNGGLRQEPEEDGLLTASISGDCNDEIFFKLTNDDSVNQKENTQSLSSCNKNPVMGYLNVDSAKEDDDFVIVSPNAAFCRTSPRQKYTRVKTSVSRKNIMMLSKSAKRKLVHTSVGKRDMDETLFVPLYTSTLQQDGTHGCREIKRTCETKEELPSEQSSNEVSCPIDLKNEMDPQVGKTHNSSFDRIPNVKPPSPNYKYRREALRKQDARRKLDGWECDDCKNYYAIDGCDVDPLEIKCRLNQCSKHRDKYPVRSSIPPGYWDVTLPNTDDSKSE